MKFGNLYAIPSRNGLTKPRSVRGDGIKFVNMGELFENERIGNIEMDRVPVSKTEMRDALLQEDDLLFARQSLVREGAGKCSIIAEVEEPTTFDSHLIRVRLNRSIANPSFYRYYFASPLSPMPGIVSQCAQAGIKGSDLKNLDVDCPPLEVQDKIASILGTYDELIENSRRQIKLLEEAAQRLYKEWFVDLKFPGHETTPIHNGLPEGWKRCHLRDVLEINGGKDYKQLKSGTYPVYGSGGLMCRVDSFLYEGESVLIPRKGTLNNVMYRNEAFWTVDTLFYTRVLLKNGGKYLFHAVRAFDFASMNIGAAVPSMTKTKLDGLVLTIPTELFLERFERAVAPFYQAMTVLQQQIAAAREARDRLLPKLMSGETAGCGR